MDFSQFESVFQKAYERERTLLFEHEAYELLSDLGFDVPKYRFIKTGTNIEELYPKLMDIPGEKLVMKIVSPQILHKMDAGGVRIFNKNEENIKLNYQTILAEVQTNRPEAEITGVLVTEFIPIEYEILISLINDREFGTFLSVGFGGIYTEIFKDFQLALTPAPREYLLSILRSMKSYPIFSGYRGLPAVSEEKLLNILQTINEFGADFSSFSSRKFVIEEFEINPFAITKDQRIVAIDSILRFSTKEQPVPEAEKANTDYIDRFFDADSTAVIGATDKQGKIGQAIMRNLVKPETFKVFPVNPKRDEVMGLKCYPSVTDIPDKIDLAVIAVPAHACPEAVRLCAEKGIKAVVLITGGFKEFGEEGARLEQEIYSTAKENNMRVVGPNCIGVFSSENNLNTFFLPEDRMMIPDTANNNLVILSQSGGLAINFVNVLQNVGVRSIVSYGNMIDADSSDFISYFDSDPKAGVILVYAEGFKNKGRKLYEAAKNISKPVVFLKGGKSEAGAKAARSHTGAMAGDYSRAKSALNQSGIIEAETFQEAMDYTKIFSLLEKKNVTGNRVCIVTNAGGLSILGADELRRTNLRLGKFTEETKQQLEGLMEGYVKPNNPLDLGGGTSDTAFTRALEVVLNDPNIDCLCLLPTIEPAPLNQERLFNELVRIVTSSAKPTAVAFAYNEKRSSIINHLEKNLIPVFPTPERAVHALDIYIKTHC